MKGRMRRLRKGIAVAMRRAEIVASRMFLGESFTLVNVLGIDIWAYKKRKSFLKTKED